ncbi:MAG: Dabb family protein [Sediminibacterium sp.]|jgi:hypothetical protein
MSKSSRRAFLTSSVLATAATVVAQPNINMSSSSFVIHQVFFWLKNQGSVADRKKLAEGLQKLSAIPEIQQLYVGFPASTEKREVVDNSWDVSELMFFNDLAAQKNYQDHPLHQAFIKEYAHLWEKVIVYDTLTIE